MNGPWHMPEHPDERDYSAQERAAEDAAIEELLEAHAFGFCPDPNELEEPWLSVAERIDAQRKPRARAAA